MSLNVNMTTKFNDYFMEFVNYIQKNFPENPDVLTAKNLIITVRKTNPKLLVKIWVNYIATPYQKFIDDGDINFFICKDYLVDLKTVDNSNKIIESINKLREPVRNMSSKDQAQIMTYIQNLCKLSKLV